MKLGLAQINTTVGDFEGNARLVREACEVARAQGAQLVVFPEMAICGYPAGDHLDDPAFLDAAEATLRELARPALWNEGLTLAVGFPERHPGPGMGVYNAAAILAGGKVQAIARKGLLPDYEVFDEQRWFDPYPEVTVVEIGGRKVGVTICEDAWNDETFHERRFHPRDPVAEVAARGAELVLNLAASPYHRGKPAFRGEMFEHAARRHGAPVVSVNLVGATDHLLFDGSSVVCDGKGTILRLPAFESCVRVVDLDDLPAAAVAHPAEVLPWPEEVRRALVMGIRDYFQKSGFSAGLLGLSGGMDSALVAALAAEALGNEKVHALRLPSRYTSDASNDDAALEAERLGIRLSTLPIEGPFAALMGALGPVLAPGRSPGLMEENLQARIRGNLLMALSNESGALLFATGNKSELAVGYATLYGDLCGALAPLADLTKTRVYEVGRAVNAAAGREVIPEAVFQKAPSAELRPDQTDQDSLPEYAVLDAILEAHVERRETLEEIVASGQDEATVKRVLQLIARAEYKRWQTPPILKVSPRCFSGGWRMPLAARYRPWVLDR
ncbi:MAG: NAD+ synthase [Deltaproteobacteria bacterium]|nr:NAD+ synthase [Deltaproteobacteria bacterium]